MNIFLVEILIRLLAILFWVIGMMLTYWYATLAVCIVVYMQRRERTVNEQRYDDLMDSHINTMEHEFWEWETFYDE